MKYQKLNFAIKKEKLRQVSASTASTVTGQLAARTVRSGHQGNSVLTQIKTESAETKTHCIKIESVEDTNASKMLSSAPLPAISDAGSACIKNNEFAQERLTQLKMEECTPDRVKAFVENSKLSIYSHPEMPKNVRFDMESDDEEDIQPASNQALEYTCEICDEETHTYRKHLKHHLLFHNMKADRKQFVHFWLEPDVSDPKHNCRACERSYSNACDYRRHLRNVHRMPIAHAATGRPKTPSLSSDQGLPAFGPNLDNINLYCRPCNKQYQTRDRFRLHQSNKHGQPLIKNPDMLPDWNDPTNHCRTCDYTFSSREVYQRHCRVSHKVSARGLIDLQQHQQLPDPLDPNYYCRVCNHHSKDLKNYRRHCRYIHGMDLNPPRLDANALPDVNDKKFYCKTCDKTFPSKKLYWKHIRLVHKLKPKAMSKSMIEPDMNDPNNYCCSCDKTFEKRYQFNTHLRKVHKLKPARKVPKSRK